jgi:menaquinone-9 beta-reductase
LRTDVAVVGAGPSGLAVAIGLRLRGFDVIVAERAHGPIDKACGEGVMPLGIAHLAELGVLDHLDYARTAPIRGIRYVNEDGVSVSAMLPDGGGLGIRRVALSAALFARAREIGVDLREDCRARWIGHDTQDGQRLLLGEDALHARFLIAADGLHSKLREQAHLDSRAPRHSRRCGLRRHVRIAPWTDHVEVHFAGDVEAYVTPVGCDEVGIAFLWDAARRRHSGGFDELLRLFPALHTRVERCEASSTARGAGPLRQRVRSIVAEDFALIGDAAGFVDAITGEGISLAMDTAAALVADLATRRRGVLCDYAAVHARAFRSYWLLTNGLLTLARRPALRRSAVALLARHPGLFEALLHHAMARNKGDRPLFPDLGKKGSVPFVHPR